MKKDGPTPPTKQESRLATTDRIAREIIRGEEEARDLKTERLKKARLARDAAEEVEAADASAKPATQS